ncbi:MAG: Hsp70 family protein [Verrucomicrobiota bacterium]
MSDVIIGIDLGTTNSAVGVVDCGFPVLIPDHEGHRLFPSFYFNRSREQIEVGHVAKRARGARPERVVYSAKRFMGRVFGDLRTEDVELSYPVECGDKGEIIFDLGEARIGAEDVSAAILSKLKKQAEAYLNLVVDRAVITVPAYFNDGQRKATKRAAEMAGLKVERIINEPTAAALAYGLGRNESDEKLKIAVYDLGGGTFDISILELSGSVFEVLATNGNTKLGGDDIDLALRDYLCLKIEESLGDKLTDSEKALVLENAERLKCLLSNEHEVELSLPFLRDSYSYQYTLRRSELDKLSAEILEKTREHCYRAMRDAKLRVDEIDKVLLVGGQTRMPFVRELIKEIFDQEPDTSINPDEAVAVGATVQAGILSGQLQNMVLLDVTPLSLGIETFGGLMNVLIPRNSTIPTKQGELFTNAVDGQKLMKISVLQGERELAKDNWRLGELEIPFSAGSRGSARVGVQFEIDQDGILHVLARDTTTGQDVKLELKSAVDVSDDEVEKMVAESVEHALDDMKARQSVEVTMKAQRQIEAAMKALALLGDGLTENEKEQILQLVHRLQEELKKDEQTVSVIKQLLLELEERAKPMAEKLMEQALDLALEKKGVL